MAAAPFPEAQLRQLRELPGNSKCCDCTSISAEWASVSHGTLLCLECAGRHRALGVQTSFVRSLLMDSWTPDQLLMMAQGGNQQIRAFFQKMHVDNAPVETLYRTKAAGYYREKLKERVQKIMAGEISGERKVHAKADGDKQQQQQHQNSQQQQHHPVFGRRKMNQLQVQFGEGPMGMSITKDAFSQAQVTRLLPGGAAQRQGIRIGDYIVGVAGKNVGNYDEVMALIPVLPRPLRLVLLQPVEEEKRPAPSTPARAPQTPQTATAQSHTTASSKQSPRIKLTGGKPAVDSDDEDDEDDDDIPAASKKLIRKSRNKGHKRSENGSAASTEHAPHTNGHSLANDELSSVDHKPVSEVVAEEDQSSCHESNGQKETQHGDGTKEVAGGEAAAEDEEVVDSDEEEESEAEDDEEEEEESEEEEEEEEVVIDIEPGMTIKVWSDAKNKYRTAVVKRKHRDDTYKVVFRDGSSESRVSLDRIAITRDVLQRHQSHSTMTTMQAAESAFAAVTFQDAASEHATVDEPEFVVRADEDIEQWIESDEAPRRAREEPKHAPPEQPRVLGKDFRVTFHAGSMGFTLTKDGSGRAIVTKVQPSGQAEQQGLFIGDIVVGVGSQWMHGYDEVMACIPSAPRPLTLVIRRKMLESVSSATLVVPDSMANPSRVKAPAKMSASMASAVVGGHDAATRRATAAVNSHLVDSEDYRARTMTTKRELEDRTDSGEFDVDFQEGDLGLRIEERGGILPVSVVTHIAAEGQAEGAGVTIGCTILGVNGERFISHAHTVSTLRHAKRPVRVRFRHCDR